MAQTRNQRLLIDDDTTLADDSSESVPTQHAVKTYVDDNAGGGAWGDITGTLADQTDLQAALDAKADTADLGTAAAADTGDFDAAGSATAAVSALAGTLGTASTHAATDFDAAGVATAAVAALAGTLGTASTHPATDFDAAGAAAAVTKTSLGLGNVTNDAQLKAADLDTTTTLGTSNTKIPSQLAVKTYVDTASGLLVPKSLFDANTILAATADNTPAALTVGTQTLVGRITGGDIAALTASQVRTLLALTASTDFPGLDGWIDVSGETWTYASVDGPIGVITVPTDYTTRVQPGWRVKFTNNSTVKKGIVHAVTATTLTIYFGTGTALTNNTISAMSISPYRAPVGFNIDPALWQEKFTTTSDGTQNTPTANTWYNPGSPSLSVPIGCWDLSWEAAFSSTSNASQTNVLCECTLSTANNSDSDNEFHGRVQIAAPSGLLLAWGSVTRRKWVTLAAKTTYFLNLRTASSTAASVIFRNSQSTMVIRARSAYL